jgi:hypothetical protein
VKPLALAIAVALVCAGAPALGADGPTSPTAPATPTRTAEEEATDLLPLLESDDFDARERASARLVEIGAPALPVIEAELARRDARRERLRALITMIRPGGDPKDAGKHQGSRRAAEPWYEAKFREAAKRVERGDFLAAVKICDAIVVLEPDCPIRERIQALKIRAKELQVRKSVIESRLIAKKVLITPGEPIELALELKNVSNAPLTLAPADAKEGEVFGALEIDTFEVTVEGERSRTVELQRIGASLATRLMPNEVWKTLVTLRPQPPLASRQVFRRVTIQGSIRSHVLMRGDEKFDRFLPLFPLEIFLVDERYHALAADPLLSLKEAMKKLRETKDEKEARESTERIFFAALLTPSNRRDQAIELLGGALEQDGDPAARAAMSALSALSDRPPEEDRQAWREWIRKRAN